LAQVEPFGDLAEAVLFLCSPAAAHITGRTIPIEDGQATL
jgi:hypothetical protein